MLTITELTSGAERAAFSNGTGECSAGTSKLVNEFKRNLETETND